MVPELINWRQVDSSNVEKVGWLKPIFFGNGEPTMYVKFKGGCIYAYAGVSRQRVVACARAKSVGSYINRVIKPNFPAVKIG